MKCPRCSVILPPRANFCPGCAQPLTTPPLASAVGTPPVVLEHERKHVTVLFADITSSLELLADRDPEDARRILDDLLQHMMDAVHRYGGTVNQVMGDGIMALFGAPVAIEEHAVRACYAALSIRNAVRRYAQQSPEPGAARVHVRIGINSGEVVVRSLSSDVKKDYTAVGLAVHLAARMEQMAPLDRIRLTGHTMRLVTGYVAATPLGPLDVRGLGVPVPVYELLGAEPVSSRLQVAAARGLSPFVGREAEVALLVRALEHVWEGRGQLVAVVGEAGVGKSRLVWELTHSSRMRPWLVLEATANLYAQTTPFFGVVELLRAYFRLEPGDDTARTQEKIAMRVSGRDASRDLMPALSALLAPAAESEQFRMLDAQERRDRMLRAVKELFVAESHVQPLLLVVDDLQAADSETLRCLDAIIESLPALRICVLMTYRSEFQHRWSGKSYYTHLRVDPLSPHSVEALLDSLLGRDVALLPLRRRLIERTEGNPFFLEESVRMLVDLNVLAGERGAYASARPVPELQVPATVQAVLARRIDRLGAEEKRLLQCAAVIGKDVPFGVLGAVAALPPPELRAVLAQLQSAEFLYESRVFPDPEFTFRHALTHEVTYGSLLLERRRELHARALSAMEARHADDPASHAELLAHQAVGGEVWDKAIDYLRLSGARAYARGALRKALERYEQALALVPRLATSDDNVRRAIDVRLDLHAPLFSLGQIPRLTELHQTADELAQALSDKPRLARVCSRLGTYAFTGGDYGRGVAYADRALALSGETGDIETGIIGLYLLGMNHVALGDVHRGADFLRRIVDGPDAELARHITGLSAAPYVLACAWLAGAYSMQGDFEPARIYAERAVRAADESDHPYAQAIAYTWRVIPVAHRGAFAEALPLCETAVQLCEKKELLGWLPFAYSLWGWVLAWAGRAKEGAPCIERAVTLFETVGIKAFLALRYVEWAEALMLEGRLDAAQVTARRAVEIGVAQSERANETWARCLLGDLALAGEPGDVGTARTYYEEARRTAQSLGLAPLVARCRLGLGRVNARTGDLETARNEFGAARGFYASAGSDYWVAQVDSAAVPLGA